MTPPWSHGSNFVWMPKGLRAPRSKCDRGTLLRLRSAQVSYIRRHWEAAERVVIYHVATLVAALWGFVGEARCYLLKLNLGGGLSAGL
jgi:hypothetical protein